MGIFRGLKYAAKGNAAPGTTALVVALAICYLLIWMRVGLEQFSYLLFHTDTALQKPWSFFTYPFTSIGPQFIGLIFLCWWLWGIGGTVERDLGTGKYLIVWFLFAGLCAFGGFIGARILGVGGTLVGAWTPVAALTVIWGTRNPTAVTLLMFVIPISGKWLAWISAGLVFFSTPDPRLAIFVAAPLALAYLFAANKIPFAPYSKYALPSGATMKHERYDKSYYEDVRKREKEREEREKLRKLFEGSMGEDKKE